MFHRQPHHHVPSGEIAFKSLAIKKVFEISVVMLAAASTHADNLHYLLLTFIPIKHVYRFNMLSDARRYDTAIFYTLD